jgi:hypothetical protein
METFVGLDVSLGETSVCILDKDGTRIFEGKVASEPAPIARLIRKRAPGVVRVGFESGPTSVWLTHAAIRALPGDSHHRRLIDDLRCWIGRFTEDDGDLRR